MAYWPFSNFPSPGATGRHWRSAAWTARAVQVRLRFLAVLAVAFLVVGRWDVIRTYWDRWTAPAARDAEAGAVSENTEYFCPMDPGVRSDWPGKCSVCNMSLVRRSKGDMGPLPSGVVARVQFSPERILLAGIRTSPVSFRPMSRAIALDGVLEREAGAMLLRQVVSPEEATTLVPGLAAEVVPEPREGAAAVAGRVQEVTGSNRVAIRIDDGANLRPGAAVRARIPIPIADIEPFRSLPSGKPAIREDEPRVAFACPEHADVVRAEAGKCPKDKNPLERIPLAANQRMDWWCPMHPEIAADHPGQSCAECGGMALAPRIVTYRPSGEVLAVPESAVIDTGTRRIVFVESMPGLFDGVEVMLGPRSEGWFSVVSGLASGQRVASSGAFLIDAETRLNPGLAAGYFGANRGGTGAPPSPPGAIAKGLDFSGLTAREVEAALRQKVCPVTGKRLGSMGSPTIVSVGGWDVFLCCEGCEDAIRKDPEKYRAKPPTAPKVRP